MDINTGVGILLNWFKLHDTFNFKLHYKKLDWELYDDGESSEDEQQAAILGGIQVMLKEEMVEKVEREIGAGKNKEIDITYVIFNSSKDSPVSIEVSRDCAENLAKVCNDFIPLLDSSCTDKFDTETLSGGSVELLLQLVSFIASQLNDEKTKSADLEKKLADKNKPGAE